MTFLDGWQVALPIVHLTTSDIAQATAGEVHGDIVRVDGATIDSRVDVSGRLFVPIVATRDGHDFVDAAVRAGAGAYLSANGDRSDRSHVEVPDTMAALGELGRFARARLDARVVGITGSVGKTSTKDLLAAVLRTTFVTHANEASFNNEMGVPLTLLNAPDETEVLVCEMGARGIGHIAMLCSIAQPVVGIVTAIEAAHTEMFGSVDQIAVAKGELVEALPNHGTAVLNFDSSRVVGLASRTAATVIGFGVENAGAHVGAFDVTIDDDLRPSFRLESDWGSTDITLAARGVHQVANALAATAGALAIGVPLDAIAQALATATLSPLRMDVQRRADGLVIIDDSYNANPTSMAAALQSLAMVPARRKIAVLGLMAELGGESEQSHAQIGELAADLGVTVIAVGTDLYGREQQVVTNVESAFKALADMQLGHGDALLVKGSRVAGLETVANTLKAK